MKKQVIDISTNAKSNAKRPNQRRSTNQKATSFCKSSTQDNKFRLPASNNSDLKSRDWKRQLGAFVQAHGYTRFNKFEPIGNDHLYRLRRNVMFEIADFLHSNKRMESVAGIRPRHLEFIMKHWQESGLSPQDQIIHFNVLNWFWRIRGIKVTSPFEGEGGNTAATDHSYSHSNPDTETDDQYRQ